MGNTVRCIIGIGVLRGSEKLPRSWHLMICRYVTCVYEAALNSFFMQRLFIVVRVEVSFRMTTAFLPLVKKPLTAGERFRSKVTSLLLAHLFCRLPFSDVEIPFYIQT